MSVVVHLDRSFGGGCLCDMMKSTSRRSQAFSNHFNQVKSVGMDTLNDHNFTIGQLSHIAISYQYKCIIISDLKDEQLLFFDLNLSHLKHSSKITYEHAQDTDWKFCVETVRGQDYIILVLQELICKVSVQELLFYSEYTPNPSPGWKIHGAVGGIAVAPSRLFPFFTSPSENVLALSYFDSSVRLKSTRDGSDIESGTVITQTYKKFKGLTFNGYGHLLLCDLSYDRVKINRNESGTKFEQIKQTQRGLEQPFQVIVDPSNQNMIVADKSTNPIKVFSPAGKLISKIPTPIEIVQSMCLNELTGEVLVVSENSIVKVFN